jgi:hypothetical protein
MKFLAVSVVCFVFVIGARAFPKLVNDEFVSEDDIASKAIADQFKTIKKLSKDNEFAEVLLRSIDQKCMVAKYKEHKLVDTMLTQEAIDFTNITPEKPVDPMLVFINIGVSCSNKLTAILGFVFDNVFSYSGLIDAFRGEQPIKEYIDDLNCYNNYAVKMNILSQEKYPKLSTTLVNETQSECDEKIAEMRGMVSASLEMASASVVTDHATCLSKEISTLAEKIFLHYVLLIPVGLSDEEKHEEKLKFVQDLLEGLEKILVCETLEKEARKTPDQSMAELMAMLKGLEGLDGLEGLMDETATKINSL